MLTDTNNQQKIIASGTVSGKDINLKVITEKIKINNLYKKIKGKINSEISINGDTRNPEISANVNIQDFVFSQSLPEIKNFNTKIYYKDKKIKINGDLIISGENYSFYASGKKDENNNYYFCQIGAKGKYNIKTNLFIYKEKVELKNFKVINKSGKEILNLSFCSGLKKDFYNDFSLGFELSNINFINIKKKISIQGDINGKLNFSEGFYGEILTDKTNLTINGYETKNIQMAIKYEKNILEIQKLEIDKNISGWYIFDFDKRTINGEVDIKQFELKKISFRELNGIINGKINFSGDINDPEIKFVHSIEKCEYKNFQFSSYLEGKYKKGEITTTGKIKPTNTESGDFNIKIYNLKEPKIYSEISFEGINILTINSLTKNFIHEDLPFTGIVFCRSKIEGDIDKPNISLEINSKSKLSYSGKILPEIWTNFELFAILNQKKNEITINKMRIESGPEIISISSGSTINLTTIERGNFNIIFRFQNFSIRPVSIFGEIITTGDWIKEKERLKINSKFSLVDLWFNQQKIKNISFNVNYISNSDKKFILLSPVEDQIYLISGKIEFFKPQTINFKNFSIQQKKNKELTSKFQLTGNYINPQINLQIEGNNIDLDTLSGLMNLQLNLNGSTDFVTFIKGNISTPYITSAVNISNGNFFNVPFTNANFQFSYKDNVLNLANIRIIQLVKEKEKLIITGSGRIPVPIGTTQNISEEKIDVSFQLEKGDISILESMSEYIKSAKGKIESKLKIFGNVNQPQLSGYLIVSDGSIYSKKYFDKLQRLNIGITFTDNKLEIKEFSGKIGEGKFEITGTLTLGKIFEIEEYNLSLETYGKKGLKIFVPELPIPIGQFLKTVKIEEFIKNYSFGEPHMSLKLTGKKDNLLFKGYIQLDNTHFSYPPPKTSPETKLYLGPLEKATWDIEIRAGENTWYESELMSANITGFLKITGTSKDLTTNGRIESNKGSINYINKIYEIKQAIFEVINDECFLQAKTETTAVFTTEEETLPPGNEQRIITTTKKTGTVEMTIPRAPIGQIMPQFYSKDYPDMESNELIQATYGITENIAPREREIIFRRQLVQLIDSTLASPLAKSLLQRSGLIDSFRVSYSPYRGTETTQTDTTDSLTLLELLSGTRYMVEKYLTGELLLGYAITLGELQKKLDLRHEIELQYRWKGNIFIRGIYGYEPKKTLEREDWQIKIEPQWRFGWPEEKNKK